MAEETQAAEPTAEPTAADPPQAHAPALTADIHMPPNSYWPLVTSIGLTIAMLGIVFLSALPAVLIVGLVILLLGIGGWVRDARKEYTALH